ncbi:MAG: FAD-binding protein, partial [Acidimicrobiales bacterium]
LHHPAMPRPLLSEALRGHGALLRDRSGDRFCDELSPRDVVSRAMAARMAEQGADHLWLDTTGLERFGTRFPTIASSLAAVGLDPARDWLPVAPAAHHVSGGVVTDLWGATALEGLWAAGEAACTGVHGANRLASNSLLEGMVFGARVADAVAGGAGPTTTGVLGSLHETADIPVRVLELPGLATTEPSGPPTGSGTPGPSGPAEPTGVRSSAAPRHHGDAVDPAKPRSVFQSAMTAGAGVVRSAASLAAARAVVEEVAAATPGADVASRELANLVDVARALLAAASRREESRGAHTRADFPTTVEAWRCRQVVDARPGVPGVRDSGDHLGEEV